MSVDNNDIDDAGAGIIEFGLAKKSVDVLRNHMNALNNMEKSIKAMVQPGSGGAFSGKFLQVAQQQLIYTKDIAAGIRQLNISATRGAGLVRQQQQLFLIQDMDQLLYLQHPLLAKYNSQLAHVGMYTHALHS